MAIFNRISNFLDNLGRPNIIDPTGGLLTDEELKAIGDRAQARQLLNAGAVISQLGAPQFSPNRNYLNAAQLLQQNDAYIQNEIANNLQNKMAATAFRQQQRALNAPTNVQQAINELITVNETPRLPQNVLQISETNPSNLGLKMPSVTTTEDLVDASVGPTSPDQLYQLGQAQQESPIGLRPSDIPPLSAQDITQMYSIPATKETLYDKSIYGGENVPEITALEPERMVETNDLDNTQTALKFGAPIVQQGLSRPELAEIPPITMRQSKLPITRDVLVMARSNPRIATDPASLAYINQMIDTVDKDNKAAMELSDFYRKINRENRNAIFQNLTDVKNYNDLKGDGLIAARYLGFDPGSVLNIDQKTKIFDILSRFDTFNDTDIRADKGNKGNIREFRKDLTTWLNSGEKDPYKQVSVKSFNNIQEKNELLKTLNTKPGSTNINISTNAGGDFELDKTVRRELQTKLRSVQDRNDKLNNILDELEGDFSIVSTPDRIKTSLVNFVNKTIPTLNIPKEILDRAAQYKSIDSQLNFILSAYVKEISGAAATDNERAFLQDQMPSTKDSPFVFKKKLANLKAFTALAEYRLNKILSSPGGRNEINNVNYEIDDEGLARLKQQDFYSKYDDVFTTKIEDAMTDYRNAFEELGKKGSINEEERDKFIAKTKTIINSMPRLARRAVNLPRVTAASFNNLSKLRDELMFSLEIGNDFIQAVRNY